MSNIELLYDPAMMYIYKKKKNLEWFLHDEMIMTGEINVLNLI